MARRRGPSPSLRWALERVREIRAANGARGTPVEIVEADSLFVTGIAVRDWQRQRTKVEVHTSFRFENHIFWWNSSAPLIKHTDWTNHIVTKSNCYWNASGGSVVFNRGQDAGSIVTDPRFKDPDHDDFTLAPDSPVWAIGFTPLDPAAAGRRTPRSLTASLRDVPTRWPESRDRPLRARP